jgi:peptidoglycan/xylan/chitin deacetylase (PgdA/CDA1 family)
LGGCSAVSTDPPVNTAAPESSAAPTVTPTVEPTPEPTVEPTATPSPEPTQEPILINAPAEIKIPIITYHAFTSTSDDSGGLWKSAAGFRRDLEAVLAAGYTPICFQDLINYVDGISEIPEKPVIINIDDGYLNNYTIAYPILKELNVKATIFVIGWSRGETTMPDGVTPILAHFSWEQAVEMKNSGLIEIQSHTYAKHFTANDGFGRHLVLRNQGEPLEDYFAVIKADDDKLQELFEFHLGKRANVFAYPHGSSNADSESVFKALGYRVTLLFGVNRVSTVRRNDPNSLYSLNRIYVTGEMSANQLLRLMEQ